MQTASGEKRRKNCRERAKKTKVDASWLFFARVNDDDDDDFSVWLTNEPAFSMRLCIRLALSGTDQCLNPATRHDESGGRVCRSTLWKILRLKITGCEPLSAHLVRCFQLRARSTASTGRSLSFPVSGRMLVLLIGARTRDYSRGSPGSLTVGNPWIFTRRRYKATWCFIASARIRKTGGELFVHFTHAFVMGETVERKLRNIYFQTLVNLCPSLIKAWEILQPDKRESNLTAGRVKFPPSVWKLRINMFRREWIDWNDSLLVRIQFSVVVLWRTVLNDENNFASRNWLESSVWINWANQTIYLTARKLVRNIRVCDLLYRCSWGQHIVWHNIKSDRDQYSNLQRLDVISKLYANLM